jgi:hypothetical protein
MLLKNKTGMRKIFLIFIVVNIAAIACAQSFKSRSYKTGIYVFCGNELPKRFSYIIEKKMPNDTSWKIVA